MLPSGILHDFVEVVGVEFFTDDPHRQPTDEFRLETVLDKVAGRNVFEDVVIEHLDRLGLKTDLPLRETARDLRLQTFEGAAHNKENVTRADGFAFGLAAPLKFKSGLELALEIVRAPQRHLGFFH